MTSAEGNRVEIVVADDGAGIDTRKVRASAVRLGLVSGEEAAAMTEAEALRLVLHSGLSTSPMITDLSGRGLGLAIVREKVEKLGGSLTLDSRPGAGTTIRMLVPLSLATFRGVFVETAGTRFLVPTSGVVRVGRVRPGDVRTLENRPTVTVDQRSVSVVKLKDLLELTGHENVGPGGARPMVVVRAGDGEVALLVDEVLGEQEVMVKRLGSQLQRVRNVSGACIAGNGAVVPILNVSDLVLSASIASNPSPMALEDSTELGRPARLLVAEDSITSRTLMKGILEGAGHEVVTAFDGMDALTKLKTEAFDLLVSDVGMPRLSGFELTARVRADKNLCDLPVVLVTALGSPRDREYGIEVGANAYIVKSDFDQSNLLETVSRLL